MQVPVLDSRKIPLMPTSPARRYRKLWRREARFDNRLRNKEALPPSTHARWKSSQKDKKTFNSHAIDAWVLAASISGAIKPSYLGLIYWTPIRLHRRQLHRFEPDTGGIWRLYGGTQSMGRSRGTLVRHVRYGLTYIGGTLKNRVSLHSIATGKRLTQNAKISDLKILTLIRFRAAFLPGIRTAVRILPIQSEGLKPGVSSLRFL